MASGALTDLGATPAASTSSMDTPSTPGAPRLARTSAHARDSTSLRATLSYKAWNRRSGCCLAQRYSTRWRARTASTPSVWLVDLADKTALTRAPPFLTSCIGEVGALPSPTVVLSAGSAVVRPPPTPSTTAAPLPGSAGYRHDIASHRPQRRGRGGPPQLTGRLSDRSTPYYAGGSINVGFRTDDVFHGLHRGCSGSAPSRAHLPVSRYHDACSGFTTRCGPVSCSTPLRRCGLTTDAGGFTTRDPDVSPDRTCTSKPSCPYGSVTSSQLLPVMAPEPLGARSRYQEAAPMGSAREADRSGSLTVRVERVPTLRSFSHPHGPTQPRAAMCHRQEGRALAPAGRAPCHPGRHRVSATSRSRTASGTATGAMCPPSGTSRIRTSAKCSAT
jgi:hypothetical protein